MGGGGGDTPGENCAWERVGDILKHTACGDDLAPAARCYADFQLQAMELPL